MIPDEIPYRETLHDDEEEPEEIWLGVGHLRDIEWWGTKADLADFHADVERRERAREHLGGFGFRA